MVGLGRDDVLMITGMFTDIMLKLAISRVLATAHLTELTSLKRLQHANWILEHKPLHYHHTSSCEKYPIQVQAENTLKQDAISIFNAAVISVLPHNMVKNTLVLKGSTLSIADVEYSVRNGVYIVAFGKAVLGMVRAAEDVLGDRLVGGIASVPVGMPATLRSLAKWDLLPSNKCPVKIKEGAHNNMPDENAFEAAKMIEDMLLRLKHDDMVLTLISGGGSALLPYPKPPVTLSELAVVTNLLSRKGATIYEMNTVRKHLEKLKGGGLARAAYPAKMAALILSDVIGDDLGFIASGPTVCNLDPPIHSLSLIEQFGLTQEMPASVLKILQSSDTKSNMVDNYNHEYGSSDHAMIRSCFDNVQTLLVGTNMIALEKAKAHAEHLGYVPIILTAALSGDVKDAVLIFKTLITFTCGLLHGFQSGDASETTYDFTSMEMNLVQMGIRKQQINEIRTAALVCRNSQKSLCILAGGETTVKVKGHGLGGRNQEMSLLLAKTLHESSHNHQGHCSNVFLSAGTDGQDGPTDAAGAVVDNYTITSALKQGLSAQEYLDNNDTYSFFKQLDYGGCHVVTGFTGTNVMDIQVLIMKVH